HRARYSRPSRPTAREGKGSPSSLSRPAARTASTTRSTPSTCPSGASRASSDQARPSSSAPAEDASAAVNELRFCSPRRRFRERSPVEGGDRRDGQQLAVVLL